MSETDQTPCPCTSGETYQMCCKPLHEGKPAENALQLMRSRFAAYALDLADYIIETTHPANPEYNDNKFAWKRSLSSFSKASRFNKLDILDFKENKSVATVTFIAHITQNDADSTFTEKSYFEQYHGRWLYLSGQLAEGHAPNLVTTAQLKLLPLAYYGDPILRRRGDSIREITKDIKTLAEDMVEMLDAYNAIGLAAPQVHHSIRLFVYRRPIEDGKGSYTPGEARVMLNPTITSTSPKMWKEVEGCVSIPSISADVERHWEIVVEYTNLQGETQSETFTGWEAKVIQHEYDHIEGILYIDRLDEEEKKGLKPFLEKLEKRIHSKMEM